MFGQKESQLSVGFQGANCGWPRWGRISDIEMFVGLVSGRTFRDVVSGHVIY